MTSFAKITLAFALASTIACDGGDDDTTSSTNPSTTTNATPATTGDDTTTTPTTDGPTGDPTTEPGTETTDGTTSDDTTTDDMTTAVALSFATDVYAPIIMPKCGCHVPGSGGLTMGGDATSAYTAMVGVASTQGTPYVAAGDPDGSYMFLKITEPPVGSLMPLGDSLTLDQISIIEDWILSGAAP